jgi:hypothetical protein
MTDQGRGFNVFFTAKIGRKPVLQGLGLAHINYFSLSVPHDIDPRFTGSIPDKSLELGIVFGNSLLITNK